MEPKPKQASFERRVFAKVIDFALAFGFVTVCGFVGDSLGLPPGWIVLPCLMTIGYLLLGDAMNGQSFGKRICGLKVVDFRHGYPCNLWQSLLRNAAGYSLVRLWQLAEESDAIAAGTFTGQIVIDVRSVPEPVSKNPEGNEPERSAPQRAKIDFDGIGDLVRKKQQ